MQFDNPAALLAGIVVGVDALFTIQYAVWIIILARAIRSEGETDYVTVGLFAKEITELIGLLWMIVALLLFVAGHPAFTVWMLLIKIIVRFFRWLAATFLMYQLVKNGGD